MRRIWQADPTSGSGKDPETLSGAQSQVAWGSCSAPHLTLRLTKEAERCWQPVRRGGWVLKVPTNLCSGGRRKTGQNGTLSARYDLSTTIGGPSACENFSGIQKIHSLQYIQDFKALLSPEERPSNK